MGRLVSIGEAASLLGLSVETMRNMEARGDLVPRRTAGGQQSGNDFKLRSIPRERVADEFVEVII
jgi:putative resolvase